MKNQGFGVTKIQAPCTPLMAAEAAAAAEEQGITTAEWLRNAVQEKLDRVGPESFLFRVWFRTSPTGDLQTEIFRGYSEAEVIRFFRDVMEYHSVTAEKVTPKAERLHALATGRVVNGGPIEITEARNG